MREINKAYKTLCDSRLVTRSLVPASPPAETSVTYPRSAGRRLTESERREIADAIGTARYLGVWSRQLLWGALASCGLVMLGIGSRLGRRTPTGLEFVLGIALLGAAAVGVSWNLWANRHE
jgi:hypothetical protein